ncbi:hypothetical protein [Aliikangiella coralliicola]|uniref:Uncharacterized protein n=1 Tax=Aliikangiella coralliicola TaxID=2592383 RepID=A0A545U7G1_9GAMM|nr:hypothetical protein [Aliikangiella coralliicola]TQV85406.1 hypothetical protein FLL46_19770 [Aliikangiella coralliicola]
MKLFTKQAPTNLALPVAIVVTSILAVMSYYRLPPMELLYKWGNTLRAGAEASDKNELVYAVVDKRQDSHTGPTLTIDLRKGRYFTWPQYAIWVEDIEGNFIQPIYVTSKLAKNNFVNKVTKIDSNIVFDSHVFLSGDVDLSTTFESGVFPESKTERARPESLPVFLYKNMSSTNDDKLIPDGDSAIADAYTGATINQSILLTSNLNTRVKNRFKIRLEINTSFDFNEFYSSDRFPNDRIYSGDGYSAQPSLVYEAIISLDDTQKLYAMELIGRGHHSGKDGNIYPDLENITTAREIIDRVIVEVNN